MKEKALLTLPIVVLMLVLSSQISSIQEDALYKTVELTHNIVSQHVSGEWKALVDSSYNSFNVAWRLIGVASSITLLLTILAVIAEALGIDIRI